MDGLEWRGGRGGSVNVIRHHSRGSTILPTTFKLQSTAVLNIDKHVYKTIDDRPGHYGTHPLRPDTTTISMTTPIPIPFPLMRTICDPNPTSELQFRHRDPTSNPHPHFQLQLQFLFVLDFQFHPISTVVQQRFGFHTHVRFRSRFSSNSTPRLNSNSYVTSTD